MNRRAAIQMSPDEVRAFIEHERTLMVATNGPDGYPHVVAMWYVVLDERIAFWTYAKSQKAANLRRDTRITCLLEAGDDYATLRGVLVKGTAVLDDDFPTVQSVGEAIHTRYAGKQLDEQTRHALAEQAEKRVVVVVEPVAVISWDHRKLGGVR